MGATIATEGCTGKNRGFARTRQTPLQRAMYPTVPRAWPLHLVDMHVSLMGVSAPSYGASGTKKLVLLLACTFCLEGSRKHTRDGPIIFVVNRSS